MGDTSPNRYNKKKKSKNEKELIRKRIKGVVVEEKKRV
jgi:hypothetical protein